ncbi:uncharacterized protein LOC107045410 [Diachasma alloeum]|uniref:uncharacterized protein LOC107045410 n=1 Tax=Diachasma alloeum TaxID=454923 RepID=UPI00073839EA|nr:uncharacterized protein LOC107045410 [Diachasma alloeum]
MSNPDAALVRSLCSDFSLSLVPHGATHHTHGSDSWLELCLIDHDDTLLSYWKTEAPFVDGHDLITATIQAVLPRPSVSRDFTYRDFAALDLDVLLSQLAASDWSVFDGLSSPDEMTACLGGNLGVAMDGAVPLKTVRKSSKRKPWFTDGIVALVAKRDRLYRVYKRTYSCQALLTYRTARDRSHREVEAARQLFFQ